MRTLNLGILIALAVSVAALLATPALAQQPSAGSLRRDARHARHDRQAVKYRLQQAIADLSAAREMQAAGGSSSPLLAPPSGMNPVLAQALLADGIVSDEEIAALQKRVDQLSHLVERWTKKIQRFQRRIQELAQIANWNQRGAWRPLIEIAGRRYGVSPAGLYRLMILESGGNRTVGGTFKGLFQYYPSTWAGSWNPWRHESIFDGWAQIRATAYALSRGMGPSQWPNTYPMAF